jgi:GDPmannose 4,6-dehydratase
MRIAIITGITGQDGAYLAELLLKNNYKVIGLVRNADAVALNGLNYLGITSQITIEACDLTDIEQILRILNTYQPSEIYNLAAQSSVSLSFVQPVETFHFNTLSVFNLLEAVKQFDRKIKFYQASSSEMFGEVRQLPITEDTEFHPKSPYGISKAAAHWICVNYRESYGLFVCCGILFNHESHLRTDNFFVKKIIREAIKVKMGLSKTITVGNLDIRRDIGYAPRYVEAMFKMMQQPVADNYLICTGSSVSLQYITEYVLNKLDVPANVIVSDKKLFRPSEIKDIYGSNKHIKASLDWHYTLSIENLLDILVEEELMNF